METNRVATSSLELAVATDDRAEPVPTDLAALRRQLRATRRGISPLERARRSARIAGHLDRLIRATGHAHSSRAIAAFLGTREEPDLRAWMARTRYRFALPIVHPRHPGRMSFHAWTPGETLRDNRFGIAEPQPERLQRRELALVLVPLVGFDDRGHRLGMGGGFYDRAFTRRAGGRPLLCGVAFDCQRVASIPIRAWDIPLDAVVTESGVYRCRKPLPAPSTRMPKT